jgi:diacylglycerol kinase
MDFLHPETLLRTRPSAPWKVISALQKICQRDPNLVMQLLLTIPVVGACMVFHTTVLQWLLIMLVTIIYMIAGIFRTAALLQIRHEPRLTPFQVSRIKCVGNMLVTVTAGLSLMTYLIVFIPLIGRM